MKYVRQGFAPLLVLIFVALTASLVGGVILWKNNQVRTTSNISAKANTDSENTSQVAKQENRISTWELIYGEKSSFTDSSPKPTQSGQVKNTPIVLDVPAQTKSIPSVPLVVTPPPPPPRIPQPPIINISYPSENQAITMNSSQQFCLVDQPSGGNTEEIQRKHSINDGAWSSYVSSFTLCFDPKEGTNRISLQYRNKYGDESQTYTRQFTFHRLQDIAVSMTGLIYRDLNCNASRDSGESGVTATTTINIFKMPEFYIYATVNSDSNGNYSFSKTITEDQSLSLQPSAVSPSGYKSVSRYSLPTLTLNSSNKNAVADIPQVPNENFSSCQ